VAGAIWLVPAVVVGLGVLLALPLLSRLRDTEIGSPGLRAERRSDDPPRVVRACAGSWRTPLTVRL
jgi:hypothetical protein